LAVLKRIFWPLLGLGVVIWSLHVLYARLISEASADPATKLLLDQAGIVESLGIIAAGIGEKLAEIPPSSYALAGLSTLLAYWALAWYDRIALIHLNRSAGISWPFVTLTSFTTYAISHNIGGSVFSGGMVRYRAYTAKGLSAAEVGVLVALCSFTFAFGTMMLMGLVFVFEPEIVEPLLPVPIWAVRLMGFGLLAFCCLYTYGAFARLKPLVIRSFRLEYPGIHIVWRQWLAAPMELIGAAGIIYFALPADGNPGFFVVMGAFLLSFSAGLLVQVPGGIGVMEAVFLKVMPGMPATEVFAALLVWRMFFLLIPLALSIPIVALFERAQLAGKP